MDSPAGLIVTCKRTRKRKEVFIQIEDHDRIVAEKDAEIAKLKELVKFTAHDIDCDAVLLDEEPDSCQCGLSQVLKSLREVTNDFKISALNPAKSNELAPPSSSVNVYLSVSGS